MKTISRVYASEAEASQAMDRAQEFGWTVDWSHIEADGVHVSYSREADSTPGKRRRPSRPISIALGVTVPLCLCLLAAGMFGLAQQGQQKANPAAPIAVAPATAPLPLIPPTNTSQPTPTTSLPTPQPTSTLSQPGSVVARVIRVIDGDTIEVEINGQVEQLRYIGIDTPEHGLPFFQESTEANRALVDGQTVRLEPDVSERDRYGRLLAYVYLTSGTFVNGALVSQGLADSVPYPPDTKHQVELDALQQEAQRQGIGMWGQAAPIAVVIDGSCSQFNSPGDDNYSKEEEYVCVTNQGASPVDMTRWWIRDKAGATYYFPAFGLAANASVRVRTGCGQPTSTDLYWCKDGSAVWNNSGDTAYLYNAQDALVNQLTY